MSHGRNLFTGYYKYKDKYYRVFGNISFKHPESGDWIKGVHYCSMEEGVYYVREELDFLNKFIRDTDYSPVTKRINNAVSINL